jgi:DNA invertase Pin-like site-specific DNA recombinase
MKVTRLESPIIKARRKKRVAAYCRVSTVFDAQLESLDTQRRHYMDYIAQHDDWVCVGVFYDEGISGTKKEKRPELMRMIEACKERKVDMVLTKSISRFSRNTADCLYLTRLLMSLDIQVYFEKENINTASMESEMFLSILSSMAQDESTSISGNAKWSLQSRFASNTFKMTSAPYGYDWTPNGLVINPITSKVVKHIFRETIQGKGRHQIAKELNAKHIPSSKGKAWGDYAIKFILSNEKYTGDCMFQKTYTDSAFKRHKNVDQQKKYLVREHHPALISHATFNKAAAMLKQHILERNVEPGSSKYSNHYAFTGKLICAHCNRPLKKVQTGWACPTHLADIKKCPMKCIKEESIQCAFMTMLNKLIYSRGYLLNPYMDSQHRSQSNEREALKAVIQEQDELQKQFANKEMDYSTYTAMKAEIKSRDDDIRKQIAKGSNQTDELMRFITGSRMLEKYDESLFIEFVDKVIIQSRTTFLFELKCGLKLKEELCTAIRL